LPDWPISNKPTLALHPELLMSCHPIAGSHPQFFVLGTEGAADSGALYALFDFKNCYKNDAKV
jgi:hypothetical protein